MKLTRRRVVVLACALAASPHAALPQAVQRKAQIGMLITSNADATRHLRAAFTRRLAELGWREGVNVEYAVRYAESDRSRYERLAAEIISRKPDLILAPYGPFAAVVKKQTRDIPIVFSISEDPVGEGLVASLARPGGHVTGVSTRSHELAGKRLQLLKEALPSVSRIGFVRRVGVPSPDPSAVEALKLAAATLGLQLIEVTHEHSRAGDFGLAFAQMAENRVHAVATVVDWNYSHHRDFIRHAAQARLPTICDATEFVEAGGFMSLSVSYTERYRKSAEYVNRILRGARPADLPVEEPTVFELTVNLKTARALGITVPQTILLRADRIIE